MYVKDKNKYKFCRTKNQQDWVYYKTQRNLTTYHLHLPARTKIYFDFVSEWGKWSYSGTVWVLLVFSKGKKLAFLRNLVTLKKINDFLVNFASKVLDTIHIAAENYSKNINHLLQLIKSSVALNRMPAVMMVSLLT